MATKCIWGWLMPILVWVYRHIGNEEKALAWFKKALSVKKESGSSHGLGNLYINMAESELERRNLSKAWEYLHEATEICKENCDKSDLTDLKQAFGKFFWHQGELSKAKNYFEESLEMAININHKRFEVMNRNWLGYLSLQEGDFEVACKFFRETEWVA